MKGEKRKVLEPISIADIFFKSRQLEKKGIDVIHFDVGEPDYEPPSQVSRATSRAIKLGKGRYTEPGGILEVREAIAQHLNEKFGTNVDPGQVLLTSGGRMALFLAFSSLGTGSRVGIVSPDWPAYRDLVRFLGYKERLFRSSMRDKWYPDPAEFKSSGCTALIINNPNNPTGTVYGSGLLKEIEGIASEKRMTVISDEVYSDYVFGSEKSFRSILQSKDCRYVYVTSLSKSYAMTGFRVGYLVSDLETVAELEKINGLILTSVPEFVQYAVIAALECKEYVKRKVKMIAGRSRVIEDAIERELGWEFLPPEGSLYVFPRIGKGVDSERFSLELLDRAHVSLTPGTVFGSPYREFVRLTLLQNEDRLKEAIERIAKFVGSSRL